MVYIEEMARHSLFHALERGVLLEKMRSSNSLALIKEATGAIADFLGIDRDLMQELLITREKKISTAIGEGVAIPHTNSYLVAEEMGSVSLVKPQVAFDFGALDQKPVHSCFFLFASNLARHTALQKKIALFCNEKEHRDLLCSFKSKRELLDRVREWEDTLSIH